MLIYWVNLLEGTLLEWICFPWRLTMWCWTLPSCESCSSQDIQSFAQQTLRALAFLHSLSLTHTDLKPEARLRKRQVRSAQSPQKDGFYWKVTVQSLYTHYIYIYIFIFIYIYIYVVIYLLLLLLLLNIYIYTIIWYKGLYYLVSDLVKFQGSRMTHRITHDTDTYQPVGMGWGNFSWLKWDHFATIAGVWPSFSTGRRNTFLMVKNWREVWMKTYRI
jgi:hypothetical protein